MITATASAVSAMAATVHDLGRTAPGPRTTIVPAPAIEASAIVVMTGAVGPGPTASTTCTPMNATSSTRENAVLSGGASEVPLTARTTRVAPPCRALERSAHV